MGPVRGEPGDEAQRLIEHRRAEKVSIEGADTFFVTLQEYVEAGGGIFEAPPIINRGHPSCDETLYVPNPRYRIQFAELIDEVVRNVIGVTSGDAFCC